MQDQDISIVESNSENDWSLPRLRSPKEKKRWVKLSPETLGLQLGVRTPSLDISVEGESGPVLNYKANVSSFVQLGLAYADLGVKGSFSTDDTEPERGKSQYTDFQFRFYTEELVYEAFFQQYQGYFIENSNELLTEHSGHYFLKPDLSLQNYSLSLLYNINPERYSLSASHGGNYHQLRPGNAWFLIGSASHQRLADRKNLIPGPDTDRWGEIATLRQGFFTTLAWGGGWGGVLKLDSLFMSGAILLSLGLQHRHLNYLHRFEEQISTVLKTHSHFNIGLASDRYSLYIGSFSESTPSEITDGRISFSTTDVGLFFSYRFFSVNPPWLNWLHNLNFG